MAKAVKFTRKQLDAARDVAEKRFSGRTNVTGVDVGYIWHGDTPTKELGVRVHVREKIPLSALEAAEIFPSDINGIPLDVIQGDYKIRRASQPVEHAARFPVLLGGISVAHKDVTAGTICAMVIDQTNQKPAILSNWHVLVGATGRVDDDILQPGPADGGSFPRDNVAKLSRSILNADGDAAIAHVTDARPWLPFIFGSFSHPSGVRDSRLGERLVKSGRTTAQTEARVDGEGTYFVSYEVSPGVRESKGIKGFKMVSVTPGNPNNDELSSGGDSGSLWQDPNDGEAVGLHFAGETNPDPRAEHAIACNLTNVMRALNIRLANAEDLLGTDIGNPQTESQTQNNYNVSIPNGGRGYGASGIGVNPAGLSVAPDWPDWPRVPVWPPIPPFPPNPWPPSPICPQCGINFGGEIPWPFLRSWSKFNHGNYDLYNFPNAEITAVEACGKTIAWSQIWKLLYKALTENDAKYASVKQDEALSKSIQGAKPGEVLAEAINQSAIFANHGIKAVSQDFRKDLTFRAAVASIKEIYLEEGWNVVHG